MADDSILSTQTVVVQAQRVFVQEIDDDVVFLDVNTGKYFASDADGKHIWNAIQAPTSISAVCDSIMKAFTDVERDTCEADALEFLNSLLAAKLIEIADE